MEIDDKQFLSLIHDQVRQIQENVVEYNSRANGLTDKGPLLDLRIEQYAALREMVAEHERILRFLRGEKVEPKAHEAKAVLTGIGMQWTAG